MEGSEAGGVVGLDAGVQGYAAQVKGGKVVRFWPAPTYGGEGGHVYDEGAMLDQARQWKDAGVAAVYIELLHPMPPSMGGSRTNYLRGAARWAWRVALGANGLKFVEVRPGEWKAAFGIMGEGEKSKTVACMKAMATFPGIDLRDVDRHPNAVVPCPDKAESALLGLYGEKSESGQVAEFEAAKAAWRAEVERRRKESKAAGPRKKKAKKAKRKGKKRK